MKRRVSGVRALPPAAAPEAYLLAVERRAQLQLAYRTWVDQGRQPWGDAFKRLQWAAGAHMHSRMAAGV